MRDSESAELLNYYISEGTYVVKKRQGMSFISYEAWEKGIEAGKGFPCAEAMLFAAGLSLDEQNAWYAAIKKNAKRPVEIYALISSKEFENAQSPFASELADTCIQLQSMALIPQGINNSTRPRRKLFMKLSFEPGKLSEEEESPCNLPFQEVYEDDTPIY